MHNHTTLNKNSVWKIHDKNHFQMINIVRFSCHAKSMVLPCLEGCSKDCFTVTIQ